MLGGCLTSDAYHLTAPKPDGSSATAALKGALEVSGKSTEEVDVIFAHGTSTPLGDVAETLAIKNVFGERAYQVPITATKSQVGHMLGAAGAVELIAAAYAVKESKIPPTINYETPDPECDLNYTPNEAVDKEIFAALSNTFGFGGHNACLSIKKYTE